jgi:Zn-dependent protease with chaperone function
MENSPTQMMAGAEIIPADAAFRPPRASLLYQVSLVPVAVMMVLLPAIYIVLLVLVAYGVYYHGTHNFNRIMAWGAIMSWRIELFKLAIYAAPLVAGIVLVFFMIKPIFAGRGRRAQPYALNPATEPRLFAFITGMCQMIGAPPPRRIDLNCELNAQAGFRRGYRSLFGRDLVLVLGLPLLATISVEEFACILAHEFGHFTQGVGMRVSYLIRSINYWFARVVFERDAWDEMLDDWERDTEGLFMTLIVVTAKAGVWVSRVILHGLMLVGHLISSTMDRQQEYNADAYAIHAVGSEVFERMLRRVALLSHASAHCLGQMQAMWKKDRALPDNFPLFLSNQVDAMPDETKTRIDDTLGLRRTSLFDTHPCDADRIRQARRLAEPGLIRSAEPATGLFENFPAPAGFVTLFHYQALGIPVTRQNLRPVQLSKTEREQARAESEAVLQRYFCRLLPLMHPVCLSSQELAPPTDAVASRRRIKEFRPRLAAVSAQISEMAGNFCEARERERQAEMAGNFCEARERERQAEMAGSLLQAQCQIDPQSFHLTDSSAEGALLAAGEARAAQEKCRRALRSVIDEFQRHFTGTLALLHLPAVANAVPDSATMESETRALAAFLRQFAKAWPVLDQCRREHALLTALGRHPAEGLVPVKIPEAVQRLNDLLYKLRDATITVSDPFEQRKQSRCLFDRLAGDRADSTNPAYVASFAANVMGQFSALYGNALGRLAQMAERIEAAL